MKKLLAVVAISLAGTSISASASDNGGGYIGLKTGLMDINIGNYSKTPTLTTWKPARSVFNNIRQSRKQTGAV